MNPYTLFNALWFVVILLLNRGSKYVYPPTDIAVDCVYYGVLGFNLSFFIPKLVHVKQFPSALTKYQPQYELTLKLSWIALVIGIVSAIGPIRVYITGGDIGALRDNYFTYNNAWDYIITYIRLATLSAFRNIILIIALYALLEKHEKAKQLIINSVLIVILESIVSGGRYVLLNTGIIIVCFYLIYASRIGFSIKHIILFTIITVVLFLLILLLTTRRVMLLYSGRSPLELLYFTIYDYFAGSVTYLGRLILRYPTEMGSTHGLNFLRGFIQPIFIILSYLGINTPEVFNRVGTLTVDPLQIGTAHNYNALTTIFGYFYIDGKLPMVLVESLIFGVICKWTLTDAKRTGNIVWIAAYLILCTQILNSSTKWFFYSMDYCLSFIYLFVLFRKDTIQVGVENPAG